MRGKPTIGTSAVLGDGITPAGAGKTLYLKLQTPRHRDHPRRCGENDVVHVCYHTILGSPPQVRGKLLIRLIRCVLSRITPAGAGKTGRRLRCLGFGQDHPRRCGENIQRKARNCINKGSPPQVRGKRNRANPADSCVRITPAGAGKTRVKI